MSSLVTAPFAQQRATWPAAGRHVLAQFDDASVVVYQAFNEQIARYAVEHQRFLGCPAYLEGRMTWIKTNYLWMMYRCGWCAKDKNQARVLAIRIRRDGFEEIVRRAAETSHGVTQDDEWRAKLERTDVRLQWDPDHNPDGSKCQRRAIQLGLKGRTAQQFHAEWILAIEDITDTLVVPNRPHAADAAAWERLVTPLETVYPPIAGSPAPADPWPAP